MLSYATIITQNNVIPYIPVLKSRSIISMLMISFNFNFLLLILLRYMEKKTSTRERERLRMSIHVISDIRQASMSDRHTRAYSRGVYDPGATTAGTFTRSPLSPDFCDAKITTIECVALRVFGTDLMERRASCMYVCTSIVPLDVLHTSCKHRRRRSWHIWSYIQGRTINFAQKGSPRIRYTGCASRVARGSNSCRGFFVRLESALE